MGLDLIEYVMAIEDAFEIAIPNEDAERLLTPRALIDYLDSRVGGSGDGPPLVQVAFYRIRAAIASELAIARNDIRPNSRVSELAPHRDATEFWHSIASRLWVQKKELAPQHLVEWLKQMAKADQTVGRAAEHLSLLRPNAIRDRTQPWTRAQIKDLAFRHLEVVIAVDREKLTEDALFVRDLGMG
jgi:hypothetical protein